MKTCSDMHIKKKHEGSNQAHASNANMSQALMTTMLNWSLSHAQTSVLLPPDAKAIGGNRVHTYQAATFRERRFGWAGGSLEHRQEGCLL